MENEEHNVRVVQQLATYQPPVEVGRAVESLLAHVPRQYLSGLEVVVLRAEAGLVRIEKRRRRRWLGRGEFILGCYFRSTAKRKARIELFVDRICDKWPPSLMHIPPLRDIRIGSTLFHEIGHHIDRHFGVDHGDPETIAKKWQKELMQGYMQDQYWYLMPLFKMAHFIWRRLRR